MNRLRRLFHRHRWTAKSVAHGEYAIVPGLATIVLSVCECGEYRTETINGHWPAKLFLPSTSTQERET
jgi:hypothetical protein